MSVASKQAPLLIKRQGSIAIVTFNRPDVHNAMNPETICRLADAWEEINAAEDIRVAVITGAGDRTFCSGGDLGTALPILTGAREPEDAWDRRLAEDPDLAGRATLKGVDMDKPVIAAINGNCLAGGMELALGCHLRIAAEGSRFALPEPKHGLIPFGGALVRLPRQVPHVRAMEILLTGDFFSAADALEFGLLNRVVAKDQVLPAAISLAERIAANGPLAVSEIIRIVNRVSGRPLDDAFEIETEGMKKIMVSADAREGPAAFIAKRTPVFKGC